MSIENGWGRDNWNSRPGQENYSSQLAKRSQVKNTPFLLRNSWGDKEGWGSYEDFANRLSPDNPTFTNALVRTIVAKTLNAPVKVGPLDLGPSWIDRQQEKLLKSIDNISAQRGYAGKSVLPLKENISDLAQTIVGHYRQNLPLDATTPSRIDQTIDEETRIMMERLHQGSMDKDHDTTDDERRVASEINALIGIKSAEELNEILVGHVFGRAADTVSARVYNKYASHQQEFKRGMDNLEKIPPDRWVVVDLQTSAIYMTPQEKYELGWTIWTMTPTGIMFKRIKRRTEDSQKFPLTLLSRDAGASGLYVHTGTLDYADILREKVPGLIQNPVNRLIEGFELGGKVQLRGLASDRVVAEMAVRSPEFTGQTLTQIGGLAYLYQKTLDMMTRAIREPDAAYQFQIRPNHVKSMLPDSLVLEIDAGIKNGKIDYDPLINGAVQRKERAQNIRDNIGLRSSNWLDEEGNPRTADKHAIEYWEEEIKKYENAALNFSSLKSYQNKK